MAESKSEKFLQRKDTTQTSAHIELVAKVSSVGFLYIRGKPSIHLFVQLFSRRCGRRPGRRHYSRIDRYPASSCLCGYRRSRSSRKCLSTAKIFQLALIYRFTNFDFLFLHDLVWPLRFIHGVLCVHYIRFLQRRTDGTNSNRFTAHISSGRRRMATGCSFIIFNWRH